MSDGRFDVLVEFVWYEGLKSLLGGGAS